MATPQPDLVETARDVSVTLFPLANDSPPGLVVVAFQQPSFGTVTFDNAEQSFTYTPSSGFVGEDSFDYTVQGPDGATATTTVTVRVVQPNRLPSAVDDTATVAPGGIVEIAPLSNDSDPDGDSLSLVALGLPEAGSVTVIDGQRLRYAPRAGFTGQDAFTYSVGDGRGGTASATVRITVAPDNRQPVAGSVRADTVAGQPVVVDLLAAATDPDGDPLTLTTLGLPEHGTVVIGGDGRVTYTPASGFDGTDRFTYTVSDGRGGTAVGEVEVMVAALNASPVAVDDTVTVESGAPISVNVLANDSDVEGGPLTLVRLSVPEHGRVTVEPDQRLTYRSEAGFVGTDSFTYTVRDPRGAESSATVVVTVTAPTAPSAFVNGYRFRRRIVIPRSSVRGSSPLLGFPLLVVQEGAWLKSVAQGGRIENELGFDLRFELEQGGKLPHDVERYDPITGRLIAWVRLPELRPESDLVLFLYYGKPGLIASEADPSATWRDYLAVWHLPDPTDRTGRGHDLTATGLSPAEGPIGSAARFDGSTSELVLADSTFLDGHTALTAQLWFDSDRLGSNRGLLVCGPITGRDLDAAFVVRHADRGLYSSQARVFTVEMSLADGRVVHESGPGRADDSLHSLALVFDRGEGTTLVIDGVADTPSYAVGSTLLGPTRIGRGPLRIGTGPLQPSAGRWLGLIDEVRLRASALSATWLATEYANQQTPEAFYGTGGEDAFGDAVQAPVALPLAAQTAVGTGLLLDPLAFALVPDGGTAELAAVGTPAHGTATIEAGKIRYTPVSGFTGTDRFTYTITKDGKSSTATVTVAVQARATESSPEQDRPFSDRLYGNPFHADGLSDRRLLPNSPIAKRFLAERTGSLVAIGWPCQVSSGDGGDVVVKIETDYEGKPSGLAIGTTAINGGHGKPATQGSWPEWSFEQPVSLEAGRAYHVVWYQVGTSGTVSVPLHRADVPIPTGQNLRGGPYEGDAGTVQQQTGGLWQAGNEHGGFLRLVWSDGLATGNPIVAGSAGLKKSFGGTVMVRERFTVTDYTRKIDGVWLRVWWESGTPSDLLVRLETLEGTLLEQLLVPRSALPQTRNVAGDAGSAPALWVYRRFAQAHILERGRSYVLRLSASTGTYIVHAVRRGEAQSREQWFDAWAEISTNGGGAWRGWSDSSDASGVTRTDCHLPIAFTIAGSIERLGVDDLIGTANWGINDVRRLAEDAGVGDDLGEARAVANGGTAWAHLGFPTPSRAPTGRQTFRIRARCSVTGGAIKAELLENGVLRRDLGTQSLGTSFSTLSFTWDASLLSDRTGARVELKLWLVDNLSSGFYVIDSVDWLADPNGSQGSGGGTGGGGGSGAGTAGELPAPVRTINVANASQLSSALSNAQPGDHIVLGDGTYNGSFSLTRAGTSANPIVVRAANLLGASIAGSFALSSNHGRLWGIKLLTNSRCTVAGQWNMVRRCKFEVGPNTDKYSTALYVTGQDIEISYCEFANMYCQALGVQPASGARRVTVKGCYFHDTSTPDPSVSIYLGSYEADEPIEAFCLVEYNLFERCPHRYGETIANKSAKNTIRFNTLLNCQGGRILNRAGHGGTINANWIEDTTGGGIGVIDRDVTLLGNRLVGSSLAFEIFAGNRNPDDPVGNPPRAYPAAWNTVMAGNIGKLTIGRYYSSVTPAMDIPARNTVVEAHSGNVSYGRHENTAVSPSTSRTIPTALKLTTSQVGPLAP